jgi:hypothetical protein
LKRGRHAESPHMIEQINGRPGRGEDWVDGWRSHGRDARQDLEILAQIWAGNSAGGWVQAFIWIRRSKRPNDLVGLRVLGRHSGLDPESSTVLDSRFRGNDARGKPRGMNRRRFNNPATKSRVRPQAARRRGRASPRPQSCPAQATARPLGWIISDYSSELADRERLWQRLP